MILDARSLPDGTVCEAELCIIGGGPAGIALAHECVASGFRVVVLESGAQTPDAATQQLYAGETIGRPYLDLTTCRLRYFGGTTNHWGGWCMPLDAVDFEEREWLPYSGWPLRKADLDPWYERAHKLCQLGAYDYDPANWGVPAAKVPAPFNGLNFVCKMFQVAPTRFGTVYETELRQAPRVSVYLNANALSFATNENGQEVSDLTAATLAGNQFIVRSRFYVLATGGIENARLLLASSGASGKGLGNEHDLVGRFFMVHLSFTSGVIALSDPYVNLDCMRSFDGKSVRYFTYVGLSDALMREQRLQNTRFMGGYQFGSVVQTLGVIKQMASRRDASWADMLSVVRNLDGIASFGVRKLLLGQGAPVEDVILGCNAEQRPNPDSRISLTSERDALGMPKVAVDWRLAPEDKKNLTTVHRLLGTEIGKARLGRLKYFLEEDEVTWPEDLRGNEHHMGTTRMHKDPTRGVVDENARVHGLANLYVAGSSVFPTSGTANPTLTIVALALRLADHLKERLA